MRIAVFDPPTDVDGVPAVESIGVCDFGLRRVMLTVRSGPKTAELLTEVVARGADMRGARPSEQELGQARILIGNRLYTRALPATQWTCREAGWWQRALWPLDVLDAASSDVSAGPVFEVHGHRSTEYIGTLDTSLLRRLDPDLPTRQLFGRRGRRQIGLRVWLDDSGRAVRIAWGFTPASEPETTGVTEWTVTEFWDFGTPAEISAPPARLSRLPATVPQMLRDLRAPRRTAP